MVVPISLTGDAHRMTDHAIGGDDTLEGHSSGLSALVGDADDMSGHARGGNDHLTGSPSLADLYGDARTMHDRTVGGDDVLESTGFSPTGCMATPRPWPTTVVAATMCSSAAMALTICGAMRPRSRPAR